MTIIEEKLRSGPVEFDVYECGECGNVVATPKSPLTNFAHLCGCDKLLEIADTLTLKLNNDVPIPKPLRIKELSPHPDQTDSLGVCLPDNAALMRAINELIRRENTRNGY